MENIWSSSNGRIELNLTMEQAGKGYHQGQCDFDIDELMQCPAIINQLKALKPALVRDELKEYGAWDSDELANHADNLTRLLWIACGDLIEGDIEP
jgi:hypothetical protein